MKLTVMRHAGAGKQDIAGLRDLLQQYVNEVMALANKR